MWNYRILAKKVPTKKKHIDTGVLEDSFTIEYGIYEVFYNDDTDKKPHSCTKESMRPVAFDDWDEEPIDAMKWTLEKMLLACEKPILDYDSFENGEIKEYHNIKKERKKKLKKLK